MLKLQIGQNNPLRIFYKNYLRFTKPTKSRLVTAKAIDVLIPVIEKDLSTLPLVIECVKRNSFNPVEKIYVVGKKGPIEKFCKQADCIFIDEGCALPISKSGIVYNGQEWHRAGWLFQQFIKLNADQLTQNEYVLVLDADTCITAKQSFVHDNGTVILNFSDEYHFPYGDYHRFLDLDKRFFLSFVCHHMVFNKKILKNLKKDIETKTGKSWVEGILSNINMQESCCFSEYELYANYLYFNYPGSFHLEYWNNKSLKIVPPVSSITGKTFKNYKSVSIHKYS